MYISLLLLHFVKCSTYSVGPDNLTFTGPEGAVLVGNVASLVCASAGGMPPPNVTIAKEDGTVLTSGLSPQDFDYTPGGGFAEERFFCSSKNIAGSIYHTVVLHGRCALETLPGDKQPN